MSLDIAIEPDSRPDLRVRRARGAVAVLFLTNGALFANILPRYPQIKDELGLSNAQFGMAVAAFPLGALIAGLAAGVLIRWFGSPRVAVITALLGAVGFLLAGVAPAGVLLAAALLLAGAMDSITDVAQNAHGLRVQKLYPRSINNSFHAVWSIGAVLGGVLGSLAAELAVPLGIHLSASAAAFGLMAVGAYRYLLPDPDPDPDTFPDVTVESPTRPAAGRLTRYAALGALVIIASSGAFVEDAGSSWAAIYLTNNLDTTAFFAGAGFVAFQGMQFLGRMSGDRLVDRFGQRLIARVGGLTVLLGMGTALLVPTVSITIIGFGLAGLGVATLIPAANYGANELPGLRPGTGLMIVSWLQRLGLFVSPPLVGAIADASSLRVGLVVVPLAGLVVLLFSRVLATSTGHEATQPGNSQK